MNCFFDELWNEELTEAFSSPCGVWIVSNEVKSFLRTLDVFVPLRGVDCFRKRNEPKKQPDWFSSPYGVWIVSSATSTARPTRDSFRPLAGCGLFLRVFGRGTANGGVFVPLRGVNCFLGDLGANSVTSEFSSPCGV